MSIPYRFSAKVVDRFGQYIAEALKLHPQSIVFTPTNITPDAFAQGIRNAITGKVQHSWAHPGIDETGKFESLAPYLRVAIESNGVVRIYDRRGTAAKPVEARAQAVALRLTRYDNAVLHAVCQLASAGAIEPPVRWLVPALKPEVIAELKTLYDIEFIDHGNEVEIV